MAKTDKLTIIIRFYLTWQDNCEAIFKIIVLRWIRIKTWKSTKKR